MLKFDPQLPLIVTKFGTRDYVMDTFHQEKIGLNPLSGFFSPLYANIHPRVRYPIRMFTTFLVLPIAYSRDACMDFNAYNVKRRGSAQGSAF